MLPFGILLALTLIFLLVWTVVDPMFWVRKDVFGTTDGLSTFGSCGIGHTNVSKAMLACLIVLAFACVIRACVSAWYGRTVSVEYSESRYVSVIVIGMLQAFPIGIPLIVLSYSNPTAKCKWDKVLSVISYFNCNCTSSLRNSLSIACCCF